jgi:organic radical activating enzyme
MNKKFNSTIYVDITGECNWGCDYCNATTKNTTGDVNKAMLPSRLIKLRTVEYDKDSVLFLITGGEPSIYGIEYNKKIINTLRKLHTTHDIHIRYVSNMSATTQFYNDLGVDSFLFSYHPTYISFTEFVTKFESINGDKIMRIGDIMYDEFKKNIQEYNPELMGNIVVYTVNGIDDSNSLAEYNNVDNIYEITRGRLNTRDDYNL